jgi:hypothetical protein
MLGYNPRMLQESKKYTREPQPRTWEAQLLARDGQGSGASVTLYRSTIADKPGPVLDPRTRVQFEQAEEDTFGYWKEDDLEGGPIAEEELLVVVKRGRDADIFERTRPPIDKTDDICTWAGSMSWKDIKNRWLYIKDANSTDSDFEGRLRSAV